ncbi:chromatin target of PRMT1 protein-like [Sinocyclocheilus rhinocerous]|uniref:chromatin target of PRMT1 protein-like n=1 Tax=Sinocyclocheilus rhinocerous TaxID=307959 RepID=UPI0007BA51C5|nr:PREDICTED: chromatin target of PRMT1 protein-like [Sinocyclocheilus rhinocerous]
MNPLDPQKIILNSTCTVSLHDRLTSLLKHQPADVMDITAAVNQQTAASLKKNQRLALEMANRPSVLAALNNISNINNQLCKVSVKARLGHPMVRVGMMGLRGQMRGGGGGGRRRGLVKGFYTRRSISSLRGVVSSLGVQKGWGQQQCGGNVIWTGPMGSRGGGAITKTGGGSFMSVSRAYSGCSRARFDSHQIPSREQLDEQLDDYMSMSKIHLDAELDPYMAQVDLDDIV